jgi:hypothetical protein
MTPKNDVGPAGLDEITDPVANVIVSRPPLRVSGWRSGDNHPAGMSRQEKRHARQRFGPAASSVHWR